MCALPTTEHVGTAAPGCPTERRSVSECSFVSFVVNWFVRRYPIVIASRSFSAACGVFFHHACPAPDLQLAL
jgi:hypothetical protein